MDIYKRANSKLNKNVCPLCVPCVSQALEETPRGSVTDRDYSDVIYPERDDELLPLTRSQTPGYSREDSVESFNSALSFDSAESRTLSCISDSILRAGSEGNDWKML